jgi:uncharacterized phiE125 gp8 family phage protein
MTPILISPPAIEPLSLADVKLWLRLDGADEDDLLQALIVSARLTIEAHIRRFCITQSWRLRFDAWPPSVSQSNSVLSLPVSPFQNVVAVRLFDAAGVASIIPPTNYGAPASPDCARIIFASAPPTPGQSHDGIEIDLVVGYGDSALSVPEPLRRAMTMLVARWYEHRGDGDSGDTRLPSQVLALAAPFRRERLV